MKILRVTTTELKINGKNLGMKTMDLFCVKIKLNSYGYLNKMNIVYRTKANKGRKKNCFTVKYLEIYCNDLTSKQIKNFIKKMKRIGISGESKIGLWEHDELLLNFDFNSGEIPLKRNCKACNYNYNTRNIWLR